MTDVKKTKRVKKPVNHRFGQPKGAQKLPEKLRHIQEEVHHYELASELVKTILDPEREKDKLARFTGTEPCTYFQPRSLFDLNLGSQAGVPFTILFTPNLYNGLYVTDVEKTTKNFGSTQTYIVSRTAPDASTLEPPNRYEGPAVITAKNPTFYFSAPLVGDQGAINLPYWSTNRWKYDIDPFTADGTNTYTCNVGWECITSGRSNNAFDFTIIMYDINGNGTQTVFPNSTIESIWNGGRVVNIPAGTWYGFSVTATWAANPEVVYVKHISIDLITPGVAPGNKWLYPFDLSSEIAQQVESIAERVEVIGASLWLQYQGSTLVNGGTVVGYRLPQGYQLQGPIDNIYDRIGQIPRVYSGPLRDGCYTYYLPTDTAQMVPLPIHAERQGPTSIISGVVDEPNVRLRVLVCMKVRATTTSAIFRPQFPLSSVRAYEAALNYLQSCPTAMCNPNHKQKIQKAYEILNRHKDAIKQGLHGVGSVAKLIAPLMATALL